jgi:hypothetical protein
MAGQNAPEIDEDKVDACDAMALPTEIDAL